MADAYKLGNKQWKNRIVKYEVVDPESILAHHSNPRIHPKFQQDVLAGALDEIGWIDDVMINLRTSDEWPDGERYVETLVDGHLRVQIALRNGETEIPAKFVDLTPKEEALALATFDPISALAELQSDALNNVLAQIETDDVDIQALLDSLSESAMLGDGDEGPDEVDEDIDAEPKIDRASELMKKWSTVNGQLWRMGDHRMLISDSRLVEAVDLVLEGQQFDMLATDPPYGVSYTGKTADELPVYNDDQEGLLDLLLTALGNAHDNCKAGGVWYVAAPAGPQFYDFATVLTGLNVWRQTLAWVKDSMVLGHSDYHYKHEAIFYGWKEGAAHQSPPDRKQVSVWEIDRPKASREHPTMKPLELYDKMIMMSSNRGEVVFDPFGGSGTTLLSCERLGRKCRTIEFAPEYGAVILERWSEATGEQPELLSTHEFEVFQPKRQVASADDAKSPITRYDVPDAFWPSDNEDGVPLLDINMMAESVDAPIAKWGYYGRTRQVGTYHFYTEDYKFEALWKDPSGLLNSGAVNAVEPNFSTNIQMPRALAIYQVFRKRWVARWWQSKGVRIFVDLNIERPFLEMNMLGVPKGWTSFFTRSVESLGLQDLDVQYELAVRWADGKTPLFVVYGGGQPTRKQCLERGWLWIPENSHVMTGRFSGGVYDQERLENETDAMAELKKISYAPNRDM